MNKFFALMAFFIVAASACVGQPQTDNTSGTAPADGGDQMPVEDGIGDGAEPLEDSSGTDDRTPVSYTVGMTSSGFEPDTLTIQQGDRVTFVNRNSDAHWPASDVHPSHTMYPGSSRSKCDTGEGDEIFDACRGLEQGEEFGFTFHETGEWTYHDHLRPSLTGTIVVE